MPSPLPPVETLLPSFRQAALAAPLSALPGWWLRLHCRLCGSTTYYPLRLMAERHGGGQALGLVLPRLRCKACKVTPAEIALTDDPTFGSPGGSPSGWYVPLVPATP